MANQKKVMVSLPNNLLQEIDGFVKDDSQDRSQFISSAMEEYIKQLRKNKVEQKMKDGYEEMSKLNLGLAMENFKLENSTFFYYEAYLAECD